MTNVTKRNRLPKVSLRDFTAQGDLIGRLFNVDVGSYRVRGLVGDGCDEERLLFSMFRKDAPQLDQADQRSAAPVDDADGRAPARARLLLSDFLAIETPQDVKGFARWGALGLCKAHGLPLHHNSDGAKWPRGFDMDPKRWCPPDFQIAYGSPDGWVRESVSAWLAMATEFRRIIRSAADAHRGLLPAVENWPQIETNLNAKEVSAFDAQKARARGVAVVVWNDGGKGREFELLDGTTRLTTQLAIEIFRMKLAKAVERWLELSAVRFRVSWFGSRVNLYLGSLGIEDLRLSALLTSQMALHVSGVGDNRKCLNRDCGAPLDEGQRKYCAATECQRLAARERMRRSRGRRR